MGDDTDLELGSEMPEEMYTDHIVVFEGEDGWRFHGKSNNGDVLYTSEAYGDKTSAREAAEKHAKDLGMEVSFAEAGES